MGHKRRCGAGVTRQLFNPNVVFTCTQPASSRGGLLDARPAAVERPGMSVKPLSQMGALKV